MWCFRHSPSGVSAESAASAGFEWVTRPDEAWTLGFGWARPVSRTAGVELRDEYVAETSYRFQLVRGLQVLFDAQLLFDPANNPSISRAWAFGVRAILHL